MRLNETDNIWFTSDTHFSHENIIRYCERPFKDVTEMNDEMIRRWNERVGKDDIVFHLGDFAWCADWSQFLKRLNGKIYLILGNHDLQKFDTRSTSLFTGIYPKLNIKIGKREVILNHEPLATWGGISRPDKDRIVYQLFGHIHSKPGIVNADTERMNAILSPAQYDVGVDNNDYTPISWNEVKEIINNQIEKSK